MAFGATITATKIDLTTGSGNLDDLMTAANSTGTGAVAGTITKSGSVYTITAASYRTLEISNGVTLNLGTRVTLEWAKHAATSSSNPALDVIAGGNITCGENCVFDFDKTNNRAYVAYFLIRGGASLIGSEDNEVILKHMRSIYLYGSSPGTCTFEWVKIQDSTSQSGYMLTLDAGIRVLPSTDSFKNVVFEDTTATPANRYGVGLGVSRGAFWNSSFEDCIFRNLYGSFAIYGSIKLKGCVFENSYSTYPRAYDAGNCYSSVYQTSSGSLLGQNYSQPFTVFEGCRFTANSNGVYAVPYVWYGSTVFFNDCDFTDSTYGVYSQTYGRAVYRNCRFTGITVNNSRRWASSGTHLHGWLLDLTVKDPGGNPLENATVSVRQRSGKEFWSFVTNSSGKIETVYGDNPVFIEKEETGTGVYDPWSTDASSGLCHDLVIAHPDYAVHTEELVFTSDLERTVVLRVEENENKTVINGSTLYGSTIY